MSDTINILGIFNENFISSINNDNMDQKYQILHDTEFKLNMIKKEFYEKIINEYGNSFQKLIVKINNKLLEDTAYAVETGIREKNCAYLIKKMRCNESLELKTHLCGRKPRIDVDNIRILEKPLDDDPYIILKQLQKN